MSGESGLIQPLFSSEAFSTLTTVVPELSKEAVERGDVPHALPTRAGDASRYRQALLTSLPLVFADFLALSACYLLPAIAVGWMAEVRSFSSVWNNLLGLFLCHVMIGSFLGLFPATGMNPVRELRNQLTSISGSFVMLIALNGLLGEVTRNEVISLGIAIPLAYFVAPISRFSMRRICAPLKWWGELVIVVGSSKHGRMVCEFLRRHPQRGLKLQGIVDERYGDYWGKEFDSLPFLGTVDQLVGVCRKNHCHWVIAAVADKTDDEIKNILTQGCLIPNLVVLNSRLAMPTIWIEASDVAGLSGIHIRDRLLYPQQRILKRLSDIFLSSILLVLFTPLFLCIALWIKARSEGPIVFRHERIGRNGRPFGALKFRTMVENAPQRLAEYLAENPTAKEEWAKYHKLKDDPRVIPGIGQFLRRTSLDELPQLWNVLAGEMSLVGPRPVYTMDEIEMYAGHYPLYLRVRPGMTGLWQVSGRNNTTFADKVRMDTYYAMNWSLWLDYFILLRTIRTVLFREGSY